MAATAEGTAHRIPRTDAEQLVRGLNLLYNRCLSYSYSHKQVQELLPNVYRIFAQAVQKTGGLNILLQEAMFYIDSTDLMYQPTSRRFADHLRRFGVESITFNVATGPLEFGTFIDAFSLIHPNAENFGRFLRERGAGCIEINKVSMRAVKEGEELVSGGFSAGGLGGSGAIGIGEGGGSFQDAMMRAVLGRLTAQEFESNVLLAQMLAQPDSLGKAVVSGLDLRRGGNGTGGGSGEGDGSGDGTGGGSGGSGGGGGSGAMPVTGPEVGEMIMGVLSQFAQSSKVSGHSLDELLTGLYSMRSEMVGILRSQKSLDEALSEEELETTADDAFDRTVCQIAADDWTKSGGNAKRMATVLTRVVPGRKELKRLLPKLKDALLEKGMTLQQWYGLVAEISNLFGVEKAMDQLATVAAEFGVTADEIVGELNRDPRSAARLILASAEIRKVGGEQAEEQMIESLLEAVDKASERLVDQAELCPRDAATMAISLDKLKTEVSQELAGRTMDQNLRQAVLKKLDNRATRSISDLKARAFATQLKNPALTPEDKSGLLEELAGQEGELDGIMETALSLIGEDEVAKQIALDIVGKVREKLRIEREKKAGSELPAGIYPRPVAEFFLRYELRRAHRYDVPFTAILVSFQGLPEDAATVKGNENSLRALANMLANELRMLLRDVDFVGHLAYNRFFVVLPMTPHDKSLHVHRKIKDQLARQVALPGGEKAWVRPRLGLETVSGGQKLTLPALYEATSRKWQEDL